MANFFVPPPVKLAPSLLDSDSASQKVSVKVSVRASPAGLVSAGLMRQHQNDRWNFEYRNDLPNLICLN